MHSFWAQWPLAIRRAVRDNWPLLEQDNSGRRYYRALEVTPDGFANALYAEQHNLPLAALTPPTVTAVQRLSPRTREHFFPELQRYVTTQDLRAWIEAWPEVDLVEALGLSESSRVEQAAPVDHALPRRPSPPQPFLHNDNARTLGRLRGRIDDEIAKIDGLLLRYYGRVPERDPRDPQNGTAPVDHLRQCLVDLAFSLEAVRDLCDRATGYANSNAYGGGR